MKSIRSLMTLVGLSMMVLVLGTAGAKAQEGQSLSSTNFAGTFTLPRDAQWGSMILPAGDYNLYFGPLTNGGSEMVEVVGKAGGSPHGLILAQQPQSTPVTNNAITCVREGDGLVVRSLEMSAIGKSVQFALPHGARLMAHNRNHQGYAQLAEGPMLIQRVPVTLAEK
jgi:hypothetical protein